MFNSSENVLFIPFSTHLHLFQASSRRLPKVLISGSKVLASISPKALNVASCETLSSSARRISRPQTGVPRLNATFEICNILIMVYV